MRYLFGFICVCALGVVPLVGCSDATKCTNAGDCDDQNVCTDDRCNAHSCDYIPNDALCDFDGLDDFFGGLDGICISGVCEENPCDDGNECTDDPPPADDGSCIAGPVCHGCNPCDWNGEPGFCIDGVCKEDPCKSVVCDDGDLCTDDSCWLGECRFYKRCVDRNVCTDDTCDPETGECSYIPADGTRCCLKWGTCGVFPERCCKVYGRCEAGDCVDPCDPESEEVSQCPIEGSSILLFCCPGSEICHYGDCPSP